METDQPLAYDPKALDPVLLELHDTVGWLLKSEDMARLEKIIKDEVEA